MTLIWPSLSVHVLKRPHKKNIAADCRRCLLSFLFCSNLCYILIYIPNVSPWLIYKAAAVAAHHKSRAKKKSIPYSFSCIKQRGSRYGHRHNQRSQSLNRGQALSRAEVGGMWWHQVNSGKYFTHIRAISLAFSVILNARRFIWHCYGVIVGGQSNCASCAMGNKLSCSCAPLMRKGYRYEDSPWQTSRRRDGHLLR